LGKLNRSTFNFCLILEHQVKKGTFTMKKLNILLLPILLLFVACEQDTPTSVSPSADELTKITLAKNPNIEATLTRGSESASFGYFTFFAASAKASNGETMEIVTDNIFPIPPVPDPDPSSNILAVNPKSVGGTGTFTHRAANGDILATGTWTATQLISFKSYGPSPILPFPNWTAGSANIRVHLVSSGGAEFDAVLRIRCKLDGVVTPPSWVEGIRINVQNGPNFNKTVVGSGTLFLALP
jgi:hypothetical protein